MCGRCRVAAKQVVLSKDFELHLLHKERSNGMECWDVSVVFFSELDQAPQSVLRTASCFEQFEFAP